MKKVIALAMIIFAMTSCNKYYKATLGSTGDNTATTIDGLVHADRYFIFRSGSQAYAMRNIAIDNDTKTVQCVLDVLPEEHQLHLTNGINGKMRYLKANRDNRYVSPVLNEVHLYTTLKNDVKAGPCKISMNEVQKIEIIDMDIKRTNKSRTIGTVAIVAGSALVIVGIGAIFATALVFF